LRKQLGGIQLLQPHAFPPPEIQTLMSGTEASETQFKVKPANLFVKKCGHFRTYSVNLSLTASIDLLTPIGCQNCTKI